MHLVDAHSADSQRLAQRHGVKRLELFGSATGEDFDPQTSDLDFLVEFIDAPPCGIAKAYFGLLDDLNALFDRPVDLISSRAIRNPYFLDSVNATRRTVYVAPA